MLNASVTAITFVNAFIQPNNKDELK